MNRILVSGYGRNVDSLDLRLRVRMGIRNGVCSSIPTTIRNSVFKNVFKNRDATSKYCKLNSKCFTPRTKNRKKFRINCRKDAIKSFEFICKVRIRIYAVERLKALALDSELIQILTSLNLEYQNYLN